MSAQVPNNQPPTDAAVVQTAPTEAATVPTETTITSTPADVVTTSTQPVEPQPDMQQAPVEANADTTQQQAAQDAQVIDAVGQALATEEISAEDIITAMVADTFGLSVNGANALVNLLLQDAAQDLVEAQTDEAMMQPTDTQQVPPMDNQQQGMIPPNA